MVAIVMKNLDAKVSATPIPHLLTSPKLLAATRWRSAPTRVAIAVMTFVTRVPSPKTSVPDEAVT